VADVIEQLRSGDEELRDSGGLSPSAVVELVSEGAALLNAAPPAAAATLDVRREQREVLLDSLLDSVSGGGSSAAPPPDGSCVNNSAAALYSDETETAVCALAPASALVSVREEVNADAALAAARIANTASAELERTATSDVLRWVDLNGTRNDGRCMPNTLACRPAQAVRDDSAAALGVLSAAHSAAPGGEVGATAARAGEALGTTLLTVGDGDQATDVTLSASSISISVRPASRHAFHSAPPLTARLPETSLYASFTPPVDVDAGWVSVFFAHDVHAPPPSAAAPTTAAAAVTVAPAAAELHALFDDFLDLLAPDDAASRDGVQLATGVSSVRAVGHCTSWWSANVPSCSEAEEGEPPQTSVNVTLGARVPATGGAPCASAGECVGGVCCGGVCVCIAPYIGERCELRAECARHDVGGWSRTACETVWAGGDGDAPAAANGSAVDVGCSCELREGGADIALTMSWQTRWVPRSNILSADDATARRIGAALRADPSGALLILFVLLLPLLVLLLVAAHLDGTSLYIERPPFWLSNSRATWSFWWRWRFHLRTRHPLLRLGSCVGGHTPHTRLQAVLLAYNQLIISGALVLAFYGTPQCFREAAAVAAVFSSAVSWVLTTAVRLLLRTSYLHSRWGRAASDNWKGIRRRSLHAELPSAADAAARVSKEAKRITGRSPKSKASRSADGDGDGGGEPSSLRPSTVQIDVDIHPPKPPRAPPPAPAPPSPPPSPPSEEPPLVHLDLVEEQLHLRSVSTGPVGVRVRAADGGKGPLTQSAAADAFIFVGARRVGRPRWPPLGICTRRVRVAVPANALPSPPPPATAFIGGGRALRGGSRATALAFALAWLINVSVALGGAIFVTGAWLLSIEARRDGAATAPDDGGGEAAAAVGSAMSAWESAQAHDYAAAAGRTFAASVALSWAIKDFSVPLIIALLPVRSQWGRRVATVVTAAVGLLAP